MPPKPPSPPSTTRATQASTATSKLLEPRPSSARRPSKNQADAEIDQFLWAGLTTSQKESLIYKDYNGNSQWYMVKDPSNNWALNSATGGLDSFKAYQSTNSGDTYIDASNSSGVVRINYETGSGTQFKVYGGSSSTLYAIVHRRNTPSSFPASPPERPLLPAGRQLRIHHQHRRSLRHRRRRHRNHQLRNQRPDRVLQRHRCGSQRHEHDTRPRGRYRSEHPCRRTRRAWRRIDGGNDGAESRRTVECIGQFAAECYGLRRKGRLCDRRRARHRICSDGGSNVCNRERESRSPLFSKASGRLLLHGGAPPMDRRFDVGPAIRHRNKLAEELRRDAEGCTRQRRA